MLKFPLKVSHVVSGFLAVFIGYTSSIAIIFQAAIAAGADQSTINSWLLSLGLGMGLTSVGLSFYYKIPIVTAWSTPGAVILATSLLGMPMSDAIGAFLMTGVFITLSGLTGSFERISKLIPTSIAAAMLAGILVQFCSEIFTYLQQDLFLVGSMCVMYILGKRFSPLYVIPFVLTVGVFISWSLGLFKYREIDLELAQFVYTSPTFSWSSVMGVVIPLFIVTMTSQNMPGIVVMKEAGYQPPISQMISTTGIATIFLAPFGGFAFNLAAITAAICMNEEAGKEKDVRYLAAASAGVFYLIFALFGGTIVVLFLMSPKALIFPLAGLALLGALENSLSHALKEPNDREAALITFLVTSSGVVFWDISSAFWGVFIGCVLHSIFSRKMV